MTIEMYLGESDSRISDESRNRDGTPKTRRRFLDARTQRPVADYEESRFRIHFAHNVEGGNEVNDPSDLVRVFEGTHKREDWERPVEAVLAGPASCLRGIDRDDSCRRSENPQVASESKGESEF